MGEAARYYWSWARETFARTFGVADGCAGLIGTVLGIVSHYSPETEQITGNWLWQLPIWTFGAVLMWRFLTTPFSLHRENDSALRKYRDRQVLNRTRAFFAVRYIESLANTVRTGGWPHLDQAAFSVCVEELDRVLDSDLPRDLIEPFVDIRYNTLRVRELIPLGPHKEEFLTLADRARSNLSLIDAAIKA
jgi:hypothetical protein